MEPRTISPGLGKRMSQGSLPKHCSMKYQFEQFGQTPMRRLVSQGPLVTGSSIFKVLWHVRQPTKTTSSPSIDNGFSSTSTEMRVGKLTDILCLPFCFSASVMSDNRRRISSLFLTFSMQHVNHFVNGIAAHFPNINHFGMLLKIRDNYDNLSQKLPFLHKLFSFFDGFAQKMNSMNKSDRARGLV